jgi:hypothetical protein
VPAAEWTTMQKGKGARFSRLLCLFHDEYSAYALTGIEIKNKGIAGETRNAFVKM